MNLAANCAPTPEAGQAIPDVAFVAYGKRVRLRHRQILPFLIENLEPDRLLLRFALLSAHATLLFFLVAEIGWWRLRWRGRDPSK